jgi:aryl-alcohol dehydrogenase-like predicted oxidoreductase
MKKLFTAYLLTTSREGKIKYIGLSAVSSATLRRAVEIVRVDAVQTDYSPFVLEIEGPTGTDLLATSRELGIAIVCAMPLGRGMITSTFASGEAVGDEKDKGPHVIPRFQEGNRENNIKIMKGLKALADKKGCTVAQLALAWLVKQGDDIIPIPGTKKLKYLDENWASLDVKLSDEDEAEIRHFVETAEIAGTALPPAFASYAYTDTVQEA